MSSPYYGAPFGYFGRNHEFFPDPFLDVSSLFMPETMRTALRWCEFIFMVNGIYRQAVDKILSYFITDIDATDCPENVRDKWLEFLYDQLDIRKLLHVIGLDLMCYGNSFVSILDPFKRYLICPTENCGFSAPLNNIHSDPRYNFDWSNFEFIATCPKCKKRSSWIRSDRRTGEAGEFSIRRWSPHEIEILFDPLTCQCSYFWKIPEDYRRLIREGKLFHLERAEWEVVEAIKNNDHIRFDKNAIYHMKEDALAGIRTLGWGISRVLTNFRQIFYVQVLHRYNEAIALDYVIPFRLITPDFGNNVVDPYLNHDLGNFVSQIRTMIRQRRRDPASWHVLPFKIQYQTLGGEARQLAPYDLLNQGNENLLNAIGVPVELYRNTLQVQTAPASLRLFEVSWSHLTYHFNKFLKFLVNRLYLLLGWEPIKLKLTKVSHADDLQRQQTRLQLMMSGHVSQTTGLKPLNIDFKEEVNRILEEQNYQARAQAKQKKIMDQSAMLEQSVAQIQQGGGAPPGGGMPPDGGAPPGGPPPGGGAPPAGGAAQAFGASIPNMPQQPVTIEELLAKANYMADWLFTLPESQKDSELIKLKKVDPTMHSVVVSMMREKRQSARLQGGSAVMAQTYGKP